MRITFYRSIVLNYIMTLCAFLIYAKMDFLLISIGFEEELSQKTWLMVVSIIPSLFVQTFNEMVRNYLISMKIYAPFTWINL